ncbi:MAG: hypothetical protein CGU28_03340 [Candidatus Dactylopiibacterium carminicum]|nr:MAG: hypothetical protein CGU28_03340 [Candidatus Dactylopiibacterium carminicum]
MLFRLAPGTSYTLNRSLDVRLALADSGVAGSQIELRIGKSGDGVQLELWNGATTASKALHTYQLNFTLTSASSGSIAVYVDGSSTPLLTQSGTLRASTSQGDNHIAFGDAHDTTYKSTLDWLIWTRQAYTPAQLSSRLPSGLGTTTGY